MTLFELEIPGIVISISDPYRHAGPNKYMVKTAKMYKENVSYLAKAYMLKNEYEMKLEHNLELTIIAYMQDKRKRDVWNLCKIIPDALNEVWYKDDSQVRRGVLEKYFDRMNPRLILKLREIDLPV